MTERTQRQQESYDPTMHIREVKANGHRISLDLAEQVLALDIPEDDPFAWQTELYPTLSRDWGGDFVSAAAMSLKAKQFDDGLYAATELAAQNGAGAFAGKVLLLTSLAARLAEGSGEALSILGGACRLGGHEVPLSEAAERGVAGTVETFLGDELASKPIGFYTWSRDLEAIFRQDRLLQTKLSAAEIRALSQALKSDAKLRAIYVRYLELVGRLTNPFAKGDLRPFLDSDNSPPTGDVSFFPPSRAHESDLIKALYGDELIPEGFNLMDELIARIRSGAIQLLPTAESGWYDHQLWSLEPLAVPDTTREASRLRLGKRYREHLLELFKGVYALTRETHAKQLEVAIARAAWGESRPRIHIRPELSAEPLPTFYLRRALSYRFIRDVLNATFGDDALRRLHRLTPAGTVKTTLADELSDMESLFAGAHATVSRELGLTPEPVSAGREVRFNQWRANKDADDDLHQDARMMVPVFHDLARGQTKVWLFLGWRQKVVHVDFVTPPRVVGNAPAIIEFIGASHSLASPVFAEAYISKILNRDEFRRHCDKHKTQTAILANLQ